MLCGGTVPRADLSLNRLSFVCGAQDLTSHPPSPFLEGPLGRDDEVSVQPLTKPGAVG